MKKETHEIYFTKKYVAYLDVLGFTEIVNSDDKKRINTYLDLIKIWKNNLKEVNDTEYFFDVIVISDSIIISVDFNDEALYYLLYVCHRIQENFIVNNIFLRGGISFGECHFDKDNGMMVGKGYIAAYKLEQEAIFPRIIIDPKIILETSSRKEIFINNFRNTRGEQPVKLIHHYHTEAYKLRQPDSFFIDYIERSIHQFMINEKEQNINFIYDHIYAALYSSQGNFNKFNWLKNYVLDSLEDYKSKKRPDYVQPFTDWQRKKMEDAITGFQNM